MARHEVAPGTGGESAHELRVERREVRPQCGSICAECLGTRRVEFGEALRHTVGHVSEAQRIEPEVDVRLEARQRGHVEPARTRGRVDGIVHRCGDTPEVHHQVRFADLDEIVCAQFQIMGFRARGREVRDAHAVAPHPLDNELEGIERRQHSEPIGLHPRRRACLRSRNSAGVRTGRARHPGEHEGAHAQRAGGS